MYTFTDVQFVNGKWFAWYYEQPKTGELLNQSDEVVNKVSEK